MNYQVWNRVRYIYKRKCATWPPIGSDTKHRQIWTIRNLLFKPLCRLYAAVGQFASCNGRTMGLPHHLRPCRVWIEERRGFVNISERRCGTTEDQEYC